MSALTLAVPPNFKAVTTKQQTVTTTSAPLTPLVASDQVKGRPDSIFIQALSTNVGKITVNFGVAVSGAAGFELVPGTNLNLPNNDPSAWQVISSSAGDKLNIIYQGGVA